MSLSKRGQIEGVLFATTHPVTGKALSDVLEIEREELEVLIEELKAEYASENHGMEIVEIGGGFQFRTKVDLKETMAKFYERKPPRLSTPMLEVLSIVAYKQPVTRPEIEKIRGVDCTAVLQGLLEKGLIEMQGRAQLPGLPVIYGVAPKFLEWFQIASLDQLPPLSEVEVLNKDITQGATHLMDLLNKDEGFTQEAIQEMDDTLQSVGRLKSIEEIEAEAFGKPASESEGTDESEPKEVSLSKAESSGTQTDAHA